jgi:hypothetical protein
MLGSSTLATTMVDTLQFPLPGSIVKLRFDGVFFWALGRDENNIDNPAWLAKF